MTEHDTKAQTRRGIRLTVTACLVFMVILLILLVNRLNTPRVMSADELRLNGAMVFDTPRRFDDFTLRNHKNEPFTRENLIGQWSLVFFGFTHCPDICPTTMAELGRLYKSLPAEIAANTQILLVSLDPARDTPEALAQYVGYFDASFTGVTGDFLSLRRFANQVNVAFSKVTLGDDYTIDHSSNLVLINPRGDYHGFFKPPFELAKLKATYSSVRQSFAH